LLPPDLADVAFGRLKTEVQWQNMFHRGGEVPRLVAVEGEVAEDGSYPIYRHPSDESPPLSPFTPTISLIREHVQKVLNHPVNHVLIQLYRSGKDHISEHSDKTVDVVRGSNIVNVSIGAQRVMTLRLKKDKTAVLPEVSASSSQDLSSSEVQTHNSNIPGIPRASQRIPLPHNSMFVMGPETNAKWLHGINPDNRPVTIKSPEEQSEQGNRISLTFRHVGTFLTKDATRIWGQGAKKKMKQEAGLVVHDAEETQRMLYAFGDENQKPNFDWEAAYGVGFDVLHLKNKNDQEIVAGS